MSNVKNVTRKQIHDSIIAGVSNRAIAIQGFSQTFKAGVTEAGKRCALWQGVNDVLTEDLQPIDKLQAALDAKLAKGKPSKAQAKAITEAARKEMGPYLTLKNQHLDMARIYMRQWLTDVQNPTIASGAKPLHDGLKPSITVKKDGLCIALIEAKTTGKKGTDSKAAPKGRKAEKRISDKGKDAGSKASSPESALRDFMENFIEEVNKPAKDRDPKMCRSAFDAMATQALKFAQDAGVPLSQLDIK